MATKRTTKTSGNMVENTETIVEEAVTPLKSETITQEEVTVKSEEKLAVEHIKNPAIITHSPVAIYSLPTLKKASQVSQMVTGVSYEILGEETSVIYGEFYKIKQGYVNKNAAGLIIIQ